MSVRYPPKSTAPSNYRKVLPMKADLLTYEFTLDHVMNELLAELQSCRRAFRASPYRFGYEDALWAMFERLYVGLMSNRAEKREAIANFRDETSHPPPAAIPHGERHSH